MSKKSKVEGEIDPNVAAQIAADVERGIALNARGQPHKAREVLVRAKAAASAAGIESATLMWCCACCADYLGDAAAALKYSSRALRLDPVSPPIRRSREIIVERIRRTLLAADPRAPIIREYAALLAEAGLDDANVLLALAIHLAIVEGATPALEVLDKLLLLKPGNAQVLRMQADLHDAQGEQDLARECRARAAREPLVNVPGAEA